MSEIHWQKSSFCGNGGNSCLELARAADAVLIRESEVPDAVLATSPPVLRALLLGLKAGEFDLG
ncbi:toxin-antitoxin system, toxin component [Wenjunlia vitaminophila]|uniref:Toxin-antitoxin system, toxin component n=1 Tax=Wenjunlia vitaminophila TaxID=76728 RepID=A0A0T6LPW3_WENVI|nr:DUF397 domain-containing protein [Wenjunlia vitaminophila]KRV47903.1 toxin-antitoxin system, toxin component [Wenjunlia vitaminophila]